MKLWKKIRGKVRRFIYWAKDTEVYWFIMGIGWKIDRAKLWVLYRTTDRYNVIKIRDLEPGYYDSDTRLLHGMFTLLTDFVEVEKANMERFCNRENCISDKIRRLLYHILPSILLDWYYYPRSRELGLKYLEWEKNLPVDNVLDDSGNITEYACPGQAEAARTIEELYLWWKDVRPNRPDPYDASGWSELSEKRCKKNGGKLWDSNPIEWDEDGIPTLFSFNSREESEEERLQVTETLNKSIEIEEAYFKEDEEMLIKLIKVRRSLWT